MHDLSTLRRLNAEATKKAGAVTRIEILKDELYASGADAFDKWDELGTLQEAQEPTESTPDATEAYNKGYEDGLRAARDNVNTLLNNLLTSS